MIQLRSIQSTEDALTPEVNEHEFLASFFGRPIPASPKQVRYMSVLYPSLDDLRNEYHAEVIPGR